MGTCECLDNLRGPIRASGEMADALASGASVRKDVGVQVPPRALSLGFDLVEA